MADTQGNRPTGNFNYVRMLAIARDTIQDREGGDYAEMEFNSAELDAINNAPESGVGAPGFDYRDLLLRYVGNFGDREGVDHVKWMNLTHEERNEIRLISSEYGASHGPGADALKAMFAAADARRIAVAEAGRLARADARRKILSEEVGGPFNYVRMLSEARDTFLNLEGYDHSAREFDASELEAIEAATVDGAGLPGFDYRDLLVRYVGNFRHQEGATYADCMQLTPEERAEVDRISQAFEPRTQTSGMSGP